jgi:hypothetical protein
MFKRNQIIVANIAERDYTGPRLVQVRSYRASDNTINVMFAMYRGKSVFSDIRISPKDVVSTTTVKDHQFHCLATCFPNKDPNDRFIKRQVELDSEYPLYAALRANYGPSETGSEIIARLALKTAA